MNRIAELRCSLGLNMKEAAEKLGIPYTTYVNYEKGTREPNSETLILLANFFGTSIDYLLGRDEDSINQNDDSDETFAILSRNAKKLSPQDRKRLLDMAKLMFREEFNE